ncbi:MAG TPA: hypothetical protein VGD08_14465 [Stellaceae bacterium]|jgi:hypothetical protein
MQDASDAVNEYLTHAYGIGLEQVLEEVTQGVVSTRLVGRVAGRAELAGAIRHPDGGISETHQGLLTVEGVDYRFRCSVFVDAGGERFVADVGELVPVAWHAVMRMWLGR